MEKDAKYQKSKVRMFIKKYSEYKNQICTFDLLKCINWYLLFYSVFVFVLFFYKSFQKYNLYMDYALTGL